MLLPEQPADIADCKSRFGPYRSDVPHLVAAERAFVLRSPILPSMQRDGGGQWAVRVRPPQSGFAGQRSHFRGEYDRTL